MGVSLAFFPFLTFFRFRLSGKSVKALELFFYFFFLFFLLFAALVGVKRPSVITGPVLVLNTSFDIPIF